VLSFRRPASTANNPVINAIKTAPPLLIRATVTVSVIAEQSICHPGYNPKNNQIADQ
jgi:hypothetical protein